MIKNRILKSPATVFLYIILVIITVSGCNLAQIKDEGPIEEAETPREETMEEAASGESSKDEEDPEEVGITGTGSYTIVDTGQVNCYDDSKEINCPRNPVNLSMARTGNMKGYSPLIPIMVMVL